LPPICFTLDLTGTVVAVNPSGAASLGFEAETLIGQSLIPLLHPQDHMRLRTDLLMLPTENTIKQGEFRFVCCNGTIIRQSTTMQMVQTVAGSEVLFLCNSLETLSAKPCRLDHGQVEQVLRQQAEWEKLMHAVVQPARQTPELRLTLRTIAVELCQQLQADRALFYQIHASGMGSLIAEATLPDCASILDYPQSLDRLQQQCLQLQTGFASIQLQPIVCCSATPSDELLGIQASIIMPILQQDELWGVLVVHQCRRSRSWQLWELGLLKQLAMYLNGVIQQAELYQKVQRLNADLERQIQARTAELELAFEFEATLKRITDNVRDSLDENQILETVVQELACAIGTSCCNASIYDLNAGTSTICYEYTTILSPYQGRVVQLDASPEIYTQLLQGQSFQFCSLNINPTRGKVSMLACPIVNDQEVLGDLWLINQPYSCFREQDIRLVQQVANQCAIAIRQARLYQAAHTQVKELERLNRLKDDFLSTVSHELRTPMSNIKMAAQMLEVVLKQAGFLRGENPKASKYFQILQAECQREISLINDLLDLSRLDTEQASPQLANIDLPSWLNAIVQPFLERTHDQQQTIQLDLPTNLPLLTTDLPSLERIVIELLQNACKYTPSRGVITIMAEVTPEHEQRETHLKIAADRPVASSRLLASDYSFYQPRSALVTSRSLLRLSVTNSGVEIPPPELTRIFEKFYRIPNNDPWQHGGTGLGLALVRKLAEWLGGSVGVESGSNQTCFTIELPLHPNI
jgi:PAS domain S-box-containing protein